MIKTILRRIFHLFTDPKRSLENFVLSTKSLWSDKIYLSILFWCRMGIKMDWKNPRTFSEKLQWLKLYNRRPEYTVMVDKIKAKEYVASIIGKEYVIPTFGVWKDPDEIDFDHLPDRFVLKCNHNSGLGMYICKDKSKIDIEKIKEALRKGLQQDYFSIHREWPYKNVERRIFAEQYMEDNGDALTDYKFFCFNGKPQFMYVSKDASAAPTTDFFDMKWIHLPFRMKDPNSPCLPEKPAKFEEMKELAITLSSGIPHVRVDFYVINNRIFFGEFTFFHNAGFCNIQPNEYEYVIGGMIKLPIFDN